MSVSLPVTRSSDSVTSFRGLLALRLQPELLATQNLDTLLLGAHAPLQLTDQHLLVLDRDGVPLGLWGGLAAVEMQGVASAPAGVPA